MAKTDPDYKKPVYEKHIKTAKHAPAKKSSISEKVIVREPNGKRKINLSTLEDKASVHIEMDPVDFDALDLLISHFNNREVYLKTISTYPEFLHGTLKKNKKENHYTLEFSDKKLDMSYSAFLEMYVIDPF